MSRLLLIALLSLISPFGYSQTVGLRVDKYIVERQIDTFLLYSFLCSGDISFDSCQNEEPHYLVWTRNGSFYLKRFDYCKTFQTILLGATNPLMFYLENRAIIDQEEIKQATYYEIKKRGKTIDTLIATAFIDHSCYHTFQFSLTKKLRPKYADVYDLDFKTFDNGRKNIYYAYNQGTKFKALIDQTTLLINELKGSDKFVPE